MNFKNPASQINQIFDFECPICCESYDSDNKFPMMICPSQHSCCLKCVNEKLFKNVNTTDCLFCKVQIKKSQAKKFRLLNEIRQTSKTLRTQGSMIKGQITNLINNNILGAQQLAAEKEKNQWLIKNIQQLTIVWRDKFNDHIAICEELTKSNEQKDNTIRNLQNKLKELTNNSNKQTQKLQQKINKLELELKQSENKLQTNQHQFQFKLKQKMSTINFLEEQLQVFYEEEKQIKNNQIVNSKITKEINEEKDKQQLTATQKQEPSLELNQYDIDLNYNPLDFQNKQNNENHSNLMNSKIF